jgi:putative colanic acid biosynthesis acetyltransferase WcaF
MDSRVGVDLANYSNRGFSRGRSCLVEALWLLAQALFVSSSLPGAGHRRLLLRVFGAKIGKGVDIKRGVRVKFPWRLVVGDNSWIGEDVWIDNLVPVTIGRNCCISQAVYLCCGSHDWSRPSFDLITRTIVIKDGAWLAARSAVAPGVTVGEGAVLGLGSVATKDLISWKVYMGVPAEEIRDREMNMLPTHRHMNSPHSSDDDGGNPTVVRMD